MKNKGIKLVALILILTATATLLSACGLFDSFNQITKVEIVPASGLTQTDVGQYTAYAGGQFSITASWDNKRVRKPDIVWHVVQDEEDSIEPTKDKSIGHAYGFEDLGKIFVYYAVIGEIESNKIAITIIEAPLEEPTITSSSHSISSGIIQQKISDGLTNVVLNASWNEDEISPDRNIAIAWFVDGVMQDGETSKTFTYNVSEISEECSVSIYVALFEDGVKKTTAQIMLEFVNSFEMVEGVKLRADETFLSKLCDNVYYVKNAGGASACAVDMECIVLPAKANQGAPCTWSVTTFGGTSKIDGDKLDTITLSYGKNVIKASVQNVESRSVTIYVLDYDFESIPASVKKHMTNRYFYGGDWHDSYLSTQEDVNAFMGYAVACHELGKGHEAYLANMTYRDIDAFSEALSNAVDEGVDESGSFSYNISISGDVGTISFGDKTVFGIPSGAYPNAVDVEQIQGYLRYSTVTLKRSALPIDSAKESMLVTNSNELYRAVSNGFKPTFENNADGKALAALYQKARDVLLNYVEKDMSDLEKVAAIYDWIVNAVDYDYAVASATGGNTSKYNAFYLEGVFNDHRAVCDGKSKAFALLCGMEDIKALRVCGYANENLSSLAEKDRTNPTYGHAWNKVLIDVDGDGVREWYAVDTTWGDSGQKSDLRTYEYLNYAYFLKTDAEMSKTHLERTKNVPATTSKTYNVYKNTFIEIDGIKMDLYIENAVELNTLLRYSKNNGYLALSVYVVDGLLDGSLHMSYGGSDMGNGQYVIYAKASI